METEIELASRMFAAYNDSAGGKTWDGRPIPPWSECGEKVQSHWRAAARCALEFSAYTSNR